MHNKKLIISIILSLALVFTLIPTTSMAASGAKGFSGKSAVNAEQLIKVAKSKIGSPYVGGAAGPNAFDCSGFVHWVMKKNGIKLTRGSSASYYKKGYSVGANINKARKGDILLFYRGGGIGHCGIYVGNGNVIHATCSGGVRITRWNGFGQSLAGVIRTFNQGGNIKVVQKTEDNQDLSKREYRITKDNFSKTVKTNAKGVATLSGLGTGTYTVEPVNTPNSYHESESLKATVRMGKTTKVVFMNEYKPGTVNFSAPVAGADELEAYKTQLAEYEAYLEDIEQGNVITVQSAGKKGEDSQLDPQKAGNTEVVTEDEEEMIEAPSLTTIATSGEFEFVISGPGMNARTVKMNANGSLLLNGLEHGEYSIKLAGGSTFTPAFEDTFMVQPGETVDVQLFFIGN